MGKVGDMSLKEELNIPEVAKFVYGEEGEIHIGDLFGGVWCADFYDEDLGEYAPTVTVKSGAEEPSTEGGLCKFCLAVAKDEE